ncbi:sulfoxide reductase catalytic subunit YedY [Tistlia consotensis]|uniref:Protein-methionine-sulfoxide reductase catalytic subunit MsrP n=1 Tax=Tistlia consotensis USBA 355 TaxID=560819 RepID=A0A1Y6CLD6_9PROT|nr:protein-methionine-sulfoxide reductase catalytic subunit MsrP [Tistlia consotensis]SMF75441.1 sulfoxide reductase catalytic subunit YedY [Tistlia consotensis USBA 355]SNS08121.1 sulfoxide reductase catalytic subunit YedY [Tistlia consotensis]
MLIKRKRGWELPESQATPESVFRQRRRLIAGLAAGPILLGAGALLAGRGASPAAAEEADPSAKLYPAKQNMRYRLDRPVTGEELATTYNNYYEFGSSKNIWREAQDLPIRPWTVSIKGMVEKPFEIAIDDLLAKMPLEERLYRHRCVEAWSMAVPWSGFALARLVELAKPLSAAKYLKMVTLEDSDVMPGQRAGWYPWPYTEGLTIAEATNELAFIATGLYGKPIPRQNGAPLRLATPWKYGFKSVKSIVSFEFTDQRPQTFWEEIQPAEYGFWANVNPKVPHPRWSQASERVLGTDERVPTQLFNGYADYVADLYKGMEGEKLYM